MERFDTSNPACENYFDQIIEAVHACGSLVSAGGMGGGGMGQAEARIRVRSR